MYQTPMPEIVPPDGMNKDDAEKYIKMAKDLMTHFDTLIRGMAASHRYQVEELRKFVDQRAPQVPIKTPEPDPDEIVAPKPINHKDIEKPFKYDGSPDQWLKWSRSFKKFIRRNDERWTTILSAIEQNKGKPILATQELEIQNEAKLGSYTTAFKEQLCEYMENCTTGTAKKYCPSVRRRGGL